MTITDQQIAILEWMGWKQKKVLLDRMNPQSDQLRWIDSCGVERGLFTPDLTLDFCHDVAMKVKLESLRLYASYTAMLTLGTVDGDNVVDATKEQRLEAVVKALGLWKD